MLNREDILNAFGDLEIALGKHAKDVQMTLVGSSTLILSHDLERMTHDIDVIANSMPLRLAGIGGVLDDLGFQIVSDVIVFLHPDYEDRTILYDSNTEMQIVALAPIDVVVSKIGRGLRKDFEDLFKSGILEDLNIEYIKEMYLEALDYQIGDISRLRGNLSAFVDEYAMLKETTIETTTSLKTNSR